MRRENRWIQAVLTLAGLIAFTGCLSQKPKDLAVIQDFEVAPYLGTWYEIARFDHVFERGLDQCRAEYALRKDGRVSVLNAGRDIRSGARKTAEGVATLAGAPNEGSLRVTFFWPFTGGYNILAWQREPPSYALVCGNTKDYFWILARESTLPPETRQKILAQAKDWGFATNRLIWVNQAP